MFCTYLKHVPIGTPWQPNKLFKCITKIVSFLYLCIGILGLNGISVDWLAFSFILSQFGIFFFPHTSDGDSGRVLILKN